MKNKQSKIAFKFHFLFFAALIIIAGCGSGQEDKLSSEPSETEEDEEQQEDWKNSGDWENWGDWGDILGMETVPGKTYYVSTSGNNSNDGSEENPFRTIGKASEIMEPGDTVIVKAGNYNERVEINKSGEPSGWISYKAALGEKVVVSRSGDMGGYNRVFWVKASYIHIEGFEVTTDDLYGAGISIEGKDSPVHHVRIFNNIARDCNGSGIKALDADYLHIRGNQVFRNSWKSTWHESGINICANRAFGSRSGFHDIIENNYCYDNDNKVPERPNGPDNPDGETDEFTDGNGIIIDYCRDKNTGILIRNNICFNNGGRGIQVTSSVNVTAVNNTLFMNSINERSKGELSNGDTSGEKNGADNVVFYNNILFAREGTILDGTKRSCLNIWNDKASCLYDYNLFYMSGNKINNFGLIEGVTDYSKGKHGNRNILNQEPLFVKTTVVNETGITNPADYDFSLKTGSPAVNSGNQAGFEKTDFFGKPRNNPDLGAIAHN